MSGGDTFPRLPASEFPQGEVLAELLTAPVLGRYEEVEPGQSFKLYVESSQPWVPGESPQPLDYYVFRREALSWHEWTLDARDVSRMPVVLLGAAADVQGMINGGLVQKGLHFQFMEVGRRVPDGIGRGGEPYWNPQEAIIVPRRGYNLRRVVAVEWPWSDPGALQ